ncbi:VOC family protein [Paenibacillus endoradicis]|uniref:VOC family protein n=1 Tax=Paenibacillus endoradicis TaxID=2972487 RepID=UPI0021597400|nr:VOC family protein [Paenibacillus endoradicis]MCR8660137.1 VOC family protein [Paenibacillus endoradicis]
MSVDVYLNFNGNCRQAVEFYAKVFNQEIAQLMTFGDIPQAPGEAKREDTKDLIMHARLQISGSNVMFSDVFPGMPFTEGNNISLALVSTNRQEIESAYEQLQVGGTITMELQETFWSKCYGMLNDKFGIHWLLSLEE